jgi:hypothetical protein
MGFKLVGSARGQWRYASFRLRRWKRSRARARGTAGPHRLPTASPTQWIDKDGPSSTLLIAFGGMDSAFGMPPFEFQRVTGETQTKRLFVRDLIGAWYHRGLTGTGLMEVRDFLEREIAASEAERVVMVGTSAGGYAAMLFGTLLQASVVLSFSPQTTIDIDDLHRMGDRRWDDQLRPLAKAEQLDTDWLDLSALLSSYNGVTRYRLFVDNTFDLDRRHVDRLLPNEHLRVYRFGHGSHRLANRLRKKGVLSLILQQAVGGAPVENEPSRKRT